MRALITGATGFLGYHLTKQLTADGWTITAVVRPTSNRSRIEPLGVKFVEADLAVSPLDALDLKNIDVVFHTAGVVSDWGPWAEFAAGTIETTRRLSEAMSVAGCRRLIHISSVSVYGRPVTSKPIVEADLCPSPPRWNYYMRSKLAAEEIVWNASRAKQLDVTVFRPAIMIGAVADRGFLPRVMESLQQKKLALIGDPATPLPLVDIRDVTRAIIQSATAPQAIGEAFTVVNPEHVTQAEFLNTIATLMNLPPLQRRLPYRAAYAAAFAIEAFGQALKLKHVPFTRYGVSFFGHRRVYSVEKLARLLNWSPRINFQASIREAVAWQLENQKK